MPAHLLVDAAGVQPQVAHRHQDPPLRRLEPVADVRQGPADDDRHRIVEVALLELLFDVQRLRRQRRERRQNSVIHVQSIPLHKSEAAIPSRRYRPYDRHRHAALKSERFIVTKPEARNHHGGSAEHKSQLDNGFSQ